VHPAWLLAQSPNPEAIRIQNARAGPRPRSPLRSMIAIAESSRSNDVILLNASTSTAWDRDSARTVEIARIAPAIHHCHFRTRFMLLVVYRFRSAYKNSEFRFPLPKYRTARRTCLVSLEITSRLRQVCDLRHF